MMLTRCPICATTFRVTSEQLKARQGNVRCGQCKRVFNAIEHLVDVRASAPENKGAPTDETIVIELSPTEESQTKAAEAPPPITPETAVAPPAVPAETPIDILLDTSLDAPLDAPRPAPTDTPATEEIPAEHTDEEKEATPEDTPSILQPSPLSNDYVSSPRAIDDAPRWPWLIAILLVLLVLVGQTLIFFRVGLAAKYPDTKPMLTTLCQVANCTIPLPSDPDLIDIEASDLHPGNAGGLELTATLRNRAPYAQTWPDLELTLTDTSDQPIVRKVLTPAQYLPALQPAGQSPEKGFAAGSDIALKLALDPGTLPADGYRLYLFYP